jgi:uncharacterized protein (DUF1810 family)
MEDNFGLQRFIDAQKGMYENALTEITNGTKKSHWMWFVFPQFVGLGKSPKSFYYAIKSSKEAGEYLNHPVVGSRLIEITAVLYAIENKSVTDILGAMDAIKLQSCMTLFDVVQTNQVIFSEVLNKYYGGNRCTKTLFYIENP